MKFKNTFLILIFTIFSLFACDDKNMIPLVCDVENPLENLTFLKEAKNNIDRIDCGGKSTITQYTYKNETVFEINICDQIADGQTLVYNCSGKIICVFGGIAGQNTCPDFEKERTNKKIVYGN
ncbi:MAG: hypothetical protein AB8B78_03680 [Polaribacter sp.]